MDRILAKADETLHVRRILAAPPEAVFRAWTDADEFRAWWRPLPYTTTAVEMDVRVGGNYRVTMERSSGGRQYLFGTYLEVLPPQRLSMTWRLEGSETDDGYAAVLTLELREAADGTELTLVHEKLPGSSLDMYLAGWSDVLDQLARHLNS